MPERLIAHYPRAAHLRIRDPLEVLAERAVVVDTQRAGEEQPVVPRDLFLRVSPDRRVDDLILRGLERRRRRGDGLDAGSRKSLTSQERSVLLGAIELATERRGRDE
jgi:hypothetical protein